MNNYNYGDEKKETVTVKRVTLSGHFTRSITIDFSKNTNEEGFYTYSGTYPGTYEIYNNETGLAVAPNSSVSPIGDKHLLLLSNATDGTYFGKDVEVSVEYTYKGRIRPLQPTSDTVPAPCGCPLYGAAQLRGRNLRAELYCRR